MVATYVQCQGILPGSDRIRFAIDSLLSAFSCIVRFGPSCWAHSWFDTYYYLHYYQLLLHSVSIPLIRVCTEYIDRETICILVALPYRQLRIPCCRTFREEFARATSFSYGHSATMQQITTFMIYLSCSAPPFPFPIVYRGVPDNPSHY